MGSRDGGANLNKKTRLRATCATQSGSTVLEHVAVLWHDERPASLLVTTPTSTADSMQQVRVLCLSRALATLLRSRRQRCARPKNRFVCPSLLASGLGHSSRFSSVATFLASRVAMHGSQAAILGEERRRQTRAIPNWPRWDAMPWEGSPGERAALRPRACFSCPLRRAARPLAGSGGSQIRWPPPRSQCERPSWTPPVSRPPPVTCSHSPSPLRCVPPYKSMCSPPSPSPHLSSFSPRRSSSYTSPPSPFPFTPPS